MKTFPALLLSASTCIGALWHQGVSTDFVKITPGVGKNIELTTNAISISMWIKIQADYTGGTLADLISKGIQTDGNHIGYNIRLETNGIEFRYQNPNGTTHVWVPNTVQPTTNTWTHLGVTYLYGTGSSIKFYLNGASVSGSWTAGNGNSVGLTNTQDWQLGAQNFGAPFVGLYDEVAVWSTVLSQQQMVSLAKSRVKHLPVMFSPSSLVVYFPLDDYANFKGIANNNGFVEMSLNQDRGKMNAPSPSTVSYSGFLSYPPNE